jgi:hypothetical protein
MALTFFWRCEVTTITGLPDDYTGGDTVGDLINSGAIHVGAGRIPGSNAVFKPSGFAGGVAWSLAEGIFPGDTASPGTSVGCMGCWVKQVGTLYDGSTGVSGFMRFRSAASTASFDISGSDGTSAANYGARVRSVATQVDISCTGAVITADNWFFVVFRWDVPNDKLRLEIYDDDLVLVDSVQDITTDLSTAYPPDIDVFNTGSWSTSAGNMYFDMFMVGDTYDEPLQKYATYHTYKQVAYPVMARMYANGDFHAHEFVQQSSGPAMKIGSNNSVQVLDMVEVAGVRGKLYANGTYSSTQFVETTTI